MANHIELNIPPDTDTEIINQKSLRKRVFVRTRISALSLIMVLAFASVGATLAFFLWTANQTPNRGTVGTIGVRIGERASLDAEAVYDTDGSYDLGKDKKVVFVAAKEGATELTGEITVSIIPQAESNGFSDNNGNLLSDGYQTFEQNWSAIKHEEAEDGTNWDYIETSIMKVYLAQGWSDKWIFQTSSGTFKYSENLKPGEETDPLISGVVLQDTVNQDTYKNIKLSVLARSVQISE